MSPESPDPASRPERRPVVRWVAGSLALALAIAITAIALTSNRSVVAGSGDDRGPSASAPAPQTDATPTPDPVTEPSLPTPTPTGPDDRPAPVSTPISSPADVATGVTATIASLEAVEGEAQGPGDVAGPAVRFSVTISNSTASAISLQGLAVSVDYGSSRSPALELPGPGASPLSGMIAPAESRAGTYIFTVPLAERDLVRITVDYAVASPPVIFEGPAPR